MPNRLVKPWQKRKKDLQVYGGSKDLLVYTGKGKKPPASFKSKTVTRRSKVNRYKEQLVL